MIAPEPALVLSDDERDCTLYVVPAAGHLGVIEESCALPHASEDPLFEVVLPCPNCRAAV